MARGCQQVGKIYARAGELAQAAFGSRGRMDHFLPNSCRVDGFAPSRSHCARKQFDERPGGRRGQRSARPPSLGTIRARTARHLSGPQQRERPLLIVRGMWRAQRELKNKIYPGQEDVGQRTEWLGFLAVTLIRGVQPKLGSIVLLEAGEVNGSWLYEIARLIIIHS